MSDNPAIQDINRPATGRQKLMIARMAQRLGIREEIEQEPMTFGVAGKLVRDLSARIKAGR